jgi:hypothetical protein
MQCEQQEQLDEQQERERARELEHALRVNALTESPDFARLAAYQNSYCYYHNTSTSKRTPTTMWQNFWPTV